MNKNYKSEGIGSSLIECAQNYIRDKKGRYITIDTGDDEYYGGARKFYEAKGYKKVGHIPEYFSKDIGKVIYYKKLD